MIKQDETLTLLEFGHGDIGVGGGSHGNIGVVVFFNQEPEEIGTYTGIPPEIKVHLEDFPVVMTFDKEESIDVLIKCLEIARSQMKEQEDKGS